MINHSSSDEHGVYAFFDTEPVPMTCRIPAGHIEHLQKRARQLYLEAEAAGSDRDRLGPLLGSLARHGRNVFTAIQSRIDPLLARQGRDPVRLWGRLRDQVRVQVVWPDGCAQPLPAAITYDFPLAADSPVELRPCPAFFADLDANVQPRCFNGQCLSNSDTVVCPAGFWGFRLFLASPPSLDVQWPIPDRGVELAVPPALVLGKSTNPDFTMRDRHLKWLRDQLSGVLWYEEDRRATLIDRLRAVQPSLIYLYCHGGIDYEQGIGWVEIGSGERLSARGLPDDLYQRWRSRPLVLLNGCSTAALGEDQPNPLSQRLLWAGAAGVVGTEIDLHELTACRFADQLVPLLLAEARELGDAVRASRLALLRAGSAVGLSYVALAPPDLCLATL